MNIKVFYNEIDPFCCAWLSNLMDKGLIRPGVICDKSILDLTPAEVKPYDLAHFFAGIAGWDYALTLAGWRFDGRVTWTGSCPCQPFSAAGKGDGFADERHLWPAWDWLIGECKPDVIFGEQVESAINHGWLDLVQTDLEAKGYAVGAVGLPACSVGAPHIRARAWFVAESDGITGGQGRALDGRRDTRGDAQSRAGFGGGELSGGLADTEHTERWPVCLNREDVSDGQNAGWSQAHGITGTRSEVCELGNADDTGSQGRPALRERAGELAAGPTGVAGGFWRPADWLPCRDGKARATQSWPQPLADGIPDRLGFVRTDSGYSLSPLIQKGEARVMRLRGYGNAIVPPLAAEFIAAYIEAQT